MVAMFPLWFPLWYYCGFFVSGTHTCGFTWRAEDAGHVASPNYI